MRLSRWDLALISTLVESRCSMSVTSVVCDGSRW